MLKPLVALIPLLALAMVTVGCATAFKPDPDYRPSSFEAWAVGNGTGSFLRAVGPAQGSGVRHAWPE